MSDELRPCPFCGFNGVEVKGNDLRGWFCECPQCWGGIKDHCASEAEAAEDWNTRPVEDALRAENDALRAQWESVPWNLLSKIADLAEEGVSFLPGDTDEADRMIDRFNDWFNANAPKGGTE